MRSLAWLAGLLLWGAAQAANVRVSFNVDKPPYAYRDEHGQFAGIEVDLMRMALARAGLEMQGVSMSKSRVLWAVTARQADAASSVQGHDGAGLYYSDEVGDFMNVAISRKSSMAQINKLADLDHYRFAVWQRGWADLGPEFEAKYKPDELGRFRSNYFQSSTQDLQVRLFWNKRVDVIVIDRVIFAWYRRQLAKTMAVDEEVVIHNIFDNRTGFAAAFIDKDVRDKFNLALRSMRADGSYQEILARYR